MRKFIPFCLLALCNLMLATASVAATETGPRPLNDAEKRIIIAFSVFKTDGTYGLLMSASAMKLTMAASFSR